MNSLHTPFATIRNAQRDDFKEAAPLIIQAMEDLACFFTQSEDVRQAIPLFEYFFQQKQNQYSYENTLIYQIEDQIAGTLSAYDGAMLSDLRAPFLQYIKDEFQISNFHPEDETQAGEFYIDTISVSPKFQGMGIGSKLMEACIEKAKYLNHKKVGLLVDCENPKAKKLYTRLGFVTVNMKEFIGGRYEHMQFTID